MPFGKGATLILLPLLCPGMFNSGRQPEAFGSSCHMNHPLKVERVMDIESITLPLACLAASAVTDIVSPHSPVGHYPEWKLAVFLPHFRNIMNKLHCLGPPESTKGHKGLRLTKVCQNKPYWYWGVVSYKKIPINPRIFALRTWKATICSKVLHLLYAQRSVLLLLCLPCIWGKEVTASSTCLTKRISESSNRGCP